MARPRSLALSLLALCGATACTDDVGAPERGSEFSDTIGSEGDGFGFDSTYGSTSGGFGLESTSGGESSSGGLGVTSGPGRPDLPDDPPPPEAVTPDLDGDGMPDLVIGTRADDVFVGRVEIYLAAEGIDLARPADVAFAGAPDDSNFGMALSVCDANGDGVDDLIVSSLGALHVILGGEDFAMAEVPSLVLTSEGQLTSVHALACDDITADGIDDIVSVGSGEAFEQFFNLIPGSPDLFDVAALDVAEVPGAQAHMGEDGNLPVPLGTGDVTGDDVPDIVFGAYLWRPEGETEPRGRVGIIEGGSDLEPDIFVEGPNPGESFGRWVAVGEVTGDGGRDLLIGSAGAAYLMAGSDSLGPDSEMFARFEIPEPWELQFAQFVRPSHQLDVIDSVALTVANFGLEEEAGYVVALPRFDEALVWGALLGPDLNRGVTVATPEVAQLLGHDFAWSVNGTIDMLLQPAGPGGVEGIDLTGDPMPILFLDVLPDPSENSLSTTPYLSDARFSAILPLVAPTVIP